MKAKEKSEFKTPAGVAARRVVFIYVNGINTFPGDSKNWNCRAVTWTHVNKDVMERDISVAEKVEYFCGPVGRAFGQQKRAAKVVELLEQYRGWEIHLAGHSNGAQVVLDALALAGWPVVKRLHLICGACEADFRWNGLNQALFTRKVGLVLVYIAEKDRALRLAHTWPAKILGYGILGLHGPRAVWRQVREYLVEMKWPEFGHSDCWAPVNFDQTMRHLTQCRSAGVMERWSHPSPEPSPLRGARENE